MTLFTKKLLKKIGFNFVERKTIAKLSKKYTTGVDFSKILFDFQNGNISYEKALENLNEYCLKNTYDKRQLNLIFLVENLQFAYWKYKEKSISKKIIIDTLSDIKTKVDGCKRIEGIYGISRPKFFCQYFHSVYF